MLLWNARLVEWYYPALAHLQNVGIVDTANAIKVVEGLNDPRYSKARAQLALGTPRGRTAGAARQTSVLPTQLSAADGGCVIFVCTLRDAHDAAST